MLGGCKNRCNHNLTRFEHIEPTCTESGQEEYFVCSNCNKMFLDEECTEEIKAVPILEAGHRTTSSYYYDASKHWKEPLCEHLTKQETAHSFDEHGVCTECGYNQHKPNLINLELTEHKLFNKAKFVYPDNSKVNEIHKGSIVISEPGTYRIANKTVTDISISAENVVLSINNVTFETPIISSASHLTLFLEAGSQNVFKSKLTGIPGDFYIHGYGSIRSESFNEEAFISANNVFIMNSSIEINNRGNGIVANSNIFLDHANLKINAETTYIENTPENHANFGLEDSDFIYKQASDKCYGRKPGTYTDFAPINEAKGLYVKGNKSNFDSNEFSYINSGIYSHGSNIEIYSGEDGMISEFGFINLDKTNVKIRPWANAFRCDTVFKANKCNIETIWGYESIEASEIELLNSNVNVLSFDDTIESSSLYEKAQNVIIDGGKVRAYSYHDDGVDAVNYCYVKSGTVDVFAAIEGEGFDVDTAVIIDSGEVISYADHSSTTYSEISNQVIVEICHYPYVWGSNVNVVLFDSSDKPIFETRYVDFGLGYIVISSPNIVIGKIYSLMINNDKVCTINVSTKVARYFA